MGVVDVRSTTNKRPYTRAGSRGWRELPESRGSRHTSKSVAVGEPSWSLKTSIELLFDQRLRSGSLGFEVSPPDSKEKISKTERCA